MRKTVSVFLSISLFSFFLFGCSGSSDLASGGQGPADTSSGSSSGGATASTGPSNVVVTVGDGSVTINWDTVSTARMTALEGDCTYNVYIASDSSLTVDNWNTLPDGAKYENVTPPFTITGLDNGKVYYIIVTQVCGGVETGGDSSEPVIPTETSVDVTTLPGPDVYMATAGDSQVTVKWEWTPEGTEYGYQAYLYMSEAGGELSKIAEVHGADELIVTDLTNDTEYCFATSFWSNTLDGESLKGDSMCATPVAGGVDTDGDGVFDASDNCPSIANAGQTDSDGNSIGNACTPIVFGVDDTTFTAVFPDANLRTCLSNYAGARGWVYAPDANGTVFCHGSGAGNISGVENLVNVTRLLLDDNGISDLGPLSGLTGLTALWLETNSIVDVSPLSGLTNLTELQLYENSIVNVGPLSGLTKLTILYLGDNSIVNVSSLSGLTSLTDLTLYTNSIVNAGPLKTLTGLDWLDLYDNNIGGQGSGNVDQLTTLTVISEIDLDGNIGMSCAEATTLIGALGTVVEIAGDGVGNLDTPTDGVNCTNP